MSEGLEFIAIKAESQRIPHNIMQLIRKMELSSENIFGIVCWVLLDSDYKSPLNNLDDHEQEQWYDWIETLNKDMLFKYYWS